MSLLSRRGFLSGAAAVAVTPFVPAPEPGRWVTYHPSADRVVSAACRAIQDVMREKQRLDVLSRRVWFPPALSRDFGFAAEGHKQRDAGGRG